MRTPAQRKASAEYAARRKKRGDRLVRVWLGKEYTGRWYDLALLYGGSERALEHLLIVEMSEAPSD